MACGRALACGSSPGRNSNPGHSPRPLKLARPPAVRPGPCLAGGPAGSESESLGTGGRIVLVISTWLGGGDRDSELRKPAVTRAAGSRGRAGCQLLKPAMAVPTCQPG
jgi:hypothetical protein